MQNKHIPVMLEEVKSFIPNSKKINVGFDEEVTIYDLAKPIHLAMNISFKPIFKEAWSNDTKWRKPDISKLKSIINKKEFVSLNDGINKMIRENKII